MPSFPGGMRECMMFLGRNIKYPILAQKAKIEGRVIVQFVVDKDGSITDTKVVRSVSPELDAEALRVVGLMPKWNPGKQRGKAVAVKYTMPIMFRLQNPKPEKEETASLQQINLKVDKDVPSENVAMVKDVLRESYREMIMEFPQGVNKSVEKLPSGGVRYHSDHRITMRVENGKSPLIIVDGKEMDKGLDIMKEIPVNQIETVSLMKDKDAIAKYGEKAKDGAIEIKTKKNKK
jgi:TonB family protein